MRIYQILYFLINHPLGQMVKQSQRAEVPYLLMFTHRETRELVLNVPASKGVAYTDYTCIVTTCSWHCYNQFYHLLTV